METVFQGRAKIVLVASNFSNLEPNIWIDFIVITDQLLATSVNEGNKLCDELIKTNTCSSQFSQIHETATCSQISWTSF